MMKFTKTLVLVFMMSFNQLVLSYHHVNFGERVESDEEFLDEFEKDERKYHEDGFTHHHGDQFQREINLAKRSGITAIENMESNAILSHNNARSRHQNTGNLKYSKLLEQHALAYAMKLARTNNFVHDMDELKRYEEGENLYYDRSNTVEGICTAVYGWYNEIQEFKYEKLDKNYNVEPIPKALGHFTQIVWKDTTEVGCAGAYGPSRYPGQGKYDTYIVCRYKAPGNVLFELPQNVQPLKPGVPSYFRTKNDLCGGCADTKPNCADYKADCNRAMFGAEIRKSCKKTCGLC